MIIAWLRKLFSTECLDCKKGRLIQNQVRLIRNNQIFEVYKCDKCKSLFI